MGHTYRFTQPLPTTITTYWGNVERVPPISSIFKSFRIWQHVAFLVAQASIFYTTEIMKIAFLIQDITTKGGTERTTCCLANEFAKHNHTVSIVSVFKNELAIKYFLNSNVEIIYLTHKEYNLKMGLGKRLGLIIKQHSLVKQCQTLLTADVIIGQKILASLLLWRGGLSNKSVACEHFKFEMYNKFTRTMRNLLYTQFRQVVVLTENDEKKFTRILKNVSVIPNMISVNATKSAGADSKRMISVGRLHPQKGYDLLLQALPRVFDQAPDWTLDIFGEGEDYEKLIELCRHLKLTQYVHFKGYTSNIEQEYAHAALYIMSSRFEGFPMVLLEAAACQLPIVSFQCPEGPETILANGGGLLVPPENSIELGKTILKVIKEDQLRAQLRNETIKITETYSPTIIYEKWMNLFRRIQIY